MERRVVRVVVIGAGAMGLAAAYHAAKAGHPVEVLVAGPEPGGMAAHFDFDGLSIERFYHFICKADTSTFTLLDELGLGDRMRWRTTTMGYFIDGKLHEWGNPIALLKFPAVSLLSRLRYGLLAFVSTRRERWGEKVELRAITAKTSLLKRLSGRGGDGIGASLPEETLTALEARALWARYGL